MRFSGILTCILALGVPLAGQRHELGLTMGRVAAQGRSELDIQGGLALQANYGIRLAGGPRAALYGEVTALANPLRDVSSASLRATRDFATLYLTPGLRIKFAPASAVSPYVALGGGYALYEQSTARIDGQPNDAPRHVHRGAFVFGGGADVRVKRWLALRGEVRDFYTGSPAFNIKLGGNQHNVVVTGGFALRFGGGD